MTSYLEIEIVKCLESTAAANGPSGEIPFSGPAPIVDLAQVLEGQKLRDEELIAAWWRNNAQKLRVSPDQE